MIALQCSGLFYRQNSLQERCMARATATNLRSARCYTRGNPSHIALAQYHISFHLQAGGFISDWSHLGGFVCGLFPSFLFLPDFKDQR